MSSIEQVETRVSPPALFLFIEWRPSLLGRLCRLMPVDCYFAASSICQSKSDKAAMTEVWKKAYEFKAYELADDERGMRAEIIYILAAGLLGEGKYDEIHEYLHPALESSPERLGIWRSGIEYLDAMAYYQAGDYESALPIFEKIASTAQEEGRKKAIESLIKQIKARLGEQNRQ